jgi:hypothetical protein
LAKKAQPAKKVEQKEIIQPAHEEKKPAEEERRSPFVVAEAAKPTAVTNADTGEGSSEEAGSAAEQTSSPEQTEDSDGEESDFAGPVSPDDLLVQNLEIWKQVEKPSIRFQFSLKNVGATGKKIRGYTFVVLKPEEGSQEQPRGSPWTPLKDGRPSIFKRGQFFSIARFKYVRGTVPQIQDVGRFTTVTIYVYTEAGSLLMEKVFDVTEILRS